MQGDISGCVYGRNARGALGVHSAINSQVSSGDVRRFRTGDEHHHRGDLLNASIAVERRGGLLRYRPITRGRIQIRVDRTRLHVVDRDAPTPDLSGESLGKHLYGALRGRVGHKPRSSSALAHARTNIDDSSTITQ